MSIHCSIIKTHTSGRYRYLMLPTSSDIQYNATCGVEPDQHTSMQIPSNNFRILGNAGMASGQSLRAIRHRKPDFDSRPPLSLASTWRQVKEAMNTYLNGVIDVSPRRTSFPSVSFRLIVATGRPSLLLHHHHHHLLLLSRSD